MNARPTAAGAVVDGVDWDRFSVVLLKPDCVRRELTDIVLAALAERGGVEVVFWMPVTVAAWQIHVHYWDMLVDADWWLPLNIPLCLDQAYVGQSVVVALVRGAGGTPARLRGLLGHFDPAEAGPGTIRGDFGTDSLATARQAGRLVENLIHTSDDEAAVARDFGTWFGADRRHLLPPTHREPAPA
ncbi:nucleoside-diphosphate kinase [Kitasatospora gansuensis]|uniref:nucleoside-diphosphate kinase n=1 Tax=Kitasatospora gansuensis TaxID=258050 RepID=A0A7W7WLF7_9ACTN|nr:nucleoside-diphosphate kinase [Kitasatospora gansuensis]MBB4951223.1 nucleoside-diphosphate kinase [Kitasatospora gansuensis]